MRMKYFFRVFSLKQITLLWVIATNEISPGPPCIIYQWKFESHYIRASSVDKVIYVVKLCRDCSKVTNFNAPSSGEFDFQELLRNSDNVRWLNFGPILGPIAPNKGSESRWQIAGMKVASRAASPSLEI